MMIDGISSINSNQKSRQQSFGQVIPPTAEFKNWLYKEIFKNKKEFIDSFEQTLAKVTQEQANENLFSINFFKGLNPTRSADSHPVIAVNLNRTGAERAQFTTADSMYRDLGMEKGTIKALEDAGTYVIQTVDTATFLNSLKS